MWCSCGQLDNSSHESCLHCWASRSSVSVFTLFMHKSQYPLHLLRILGHWFHLDLFHGLTGHFYGFYNFWSLKLHQWQCTLQKSSDYSWRYESRSGVYTQEYQIKAVTTGVDYLPRVWSFQSSRTTYDNRRYCLLLHVAWNTEPKNNINTHQIGVT